MEEELISSVKTIIVGLVTIIIFIVIATMILSGFGPLTKEYQSVSAGDFIISLSAPSMSCTNGWKIDFGEVNITDSQLRNIDVIPILAFSGGQSFGFAETQAGMAESDVSFFGSSRGVIVLTGGKGSASDLQFYSTDFTSGGSIALPNRQTLDVMLGLWIWPGGRGCVYQAMTNSTDGSWAHTGLTDVLRYTSTNCPETYITVVHKNLTNQCTLTPAPTQPPATPQLSACEQQAAQGSTYACLEKCDPGLGATPGSVTYPRVYYSCQPTWPSGYECCDINPATALQH